MKTEGMDADGPDTAYVQAPAASVTDAEVRFLPSSLFTYTDHKSS